MTGGMMTAPLPLAVAGFAALITSAAWVNAKAQLFYDVGLGYSLITTSNKIARAERRDQLNLFYILEERAISTTTASSPFLVYNDQEWTFKEVYDIVLQYGSWLKINYAIAPKEVVAMDFMNCPRFIFLWLALWSLGACPAFINYNLTGQPLLHCIRTSTARVLFVDEEIKSQFTQDILDAMAAPGFRDENGAVEVVNFNTDTERRILVEKGLREPDSSRAGAKLHDMASLIYTSGTTGFPKPAIISWKKCRIGGGFTSIWLGLKSDDRFYTCMPLYHSSAALLGFCTCLYAGSTFVIGHKFSTQKFWSEVRASNASIIQYVGETCRYLLGAPPQIDPISGENLDKKHNVRIAFGNGLRSDIWNRFKERFGIDTVVEFYAATESPSGCWNVSSNNFGIGAIGRHGMLATQLLRLNTAIVELDWEAEVPLRSSRGYCREVSTNSPGELLYKIDAQAIEKKFQGYLNNSQATEGKILRNVFKQGDAWFRTGDVIRIDSNGRWYFCDRIGDTFRWKSENVSTAEVSEVLGTHPAVREANVYGVEIPHHDGRAGCAALTLDGGKATTEVLDGIARVAETGLPKYAVPLFLRVVSGEMAPTGNNKQQKHHLRSQGVDPEKIRRGSEGVGDRIYRLKAGRYVELSDEGWEEIKAGKARL